MGGILFKVGRRMTVGGGGTIFFFFMIGEVYFLSRYIWVLGWVSIFFIRWKKSMHGKALFASDLFKAKEIMGEDRPWELRSLEREVRGLNVGNG